MERSLVRSPQSPLRCPFCHESLEPEQDAWVACRGCLGRHHAGCWSESGRCAACGQADHLQGGAPSPTQSDLQRGRERVLRIIDLEEQGEDRDLLDLGWGFMTLGLIPLLEAESRLLDHVADHPGGRTGPRLGTGHLETRTFRYRGEAFEEIARGARRRMLAVGLGFGLTGAALLTAGVLVAGSGATGSPWAVPWAAGAALTWLLTLAGGALAHLRAVKRHELKQLYLELLERGSEYDAAVALRDHRGFWSGVGRQVGALTLLSVLLPPLAPLLVTLALRTPLRAHLNRELEAEGHAEGERGRRSSA